MLDYLISLSITVETSNAMQLNIKYDYPENKRFMRKQYFVETMSQHLSVYGTKVVIMHLNVAVIELKMLEYVSG